MRSSKAPPNQKNRGQFLPQPTRTHRSRIGLRAALKSIGLGNVICIIVTSFLHANRPLTNATNLTEGIINKQVPNTLDVSS